MNYGELIVDLYRDELKQRFNKLCRKASLKTKTWGVVDFGATTNSISVTIAWDNLISETTAYQYYSDP